MIPSPGESGNRAPSLVYKPQIQSGLQSLLLLSSEDCSWSRQGSWDIEFLLICLNIAADAAQSELQCGNVGDSQCFCRLAEVEREWLVWAFCLHGLHMMRPVRDRAQTPTPLFFTDCPPVRPDYVLNPLVCRDGCGKNACWAEPSGAVETRRERPGDSTPLEW